MRRASDSLNTMLTWHKRHYYTSIQFPELRFKRTLRLRFPQSTGILLTLAIFGVEYEQYSFGFARSS